VRLIRIADGAELVVRDYDYFGPIRRHSHWAANGGQAMLESLQAVFEPFARQLSDNVFLLYPLGSLTSSVPVGAGLDTEKPSTHYQRVDTLRPTLYWQRFPLEKDLRSSRAEVARVRDVTYEFLVARLDHGVPGEIVYRRKGLTDSKHTLETPLDPTSMYAWTVRARFFLDGRERVTEWAAMNPPLHTEVASVPPLRPYRFDFSRLAR
jgi:hypothetical protein